MFELDKLIDSNMGGAKQDISSYVRKFLINDLSRVYKFIDVRGFKVFITIYKNT
jgi:hypothetical protein